jgi:hypothetical protein
MKLEVKARTLFIPMWHYNNWLGEAVGWSEVIEYDLYRLQFYNWNDDGVNLNIDGESHAVDTIAEHLISSMVNCESKTI